MDFPLLLPENVNQINIKNLLRKGDNEFLDGKSPIQLFALFFLHKKEAPFYRYSIHMAQHVQSFDIQNKYIFGLLLLIYGLKKSR